MDVHHTAALGLAGFGAVQAVIDRQEMFRRQFVGPFDEESLAAACLKRRTRACRSVTPQSSSRKIAMQLAFNLPHGDSEIRNLRGRFKAEDRTHTNSSGNLRDRQRIDKLCK